MHLSVSGWRNGPNGLQAALMSGKWSADARVPCLAPLDSNLSKVDGIVVLHAIKILRCEGRMIRAAIVFSSFDDPGNHKAVLSLGEDAYFAKPQDLAEMHASGDNIRGIWEHLNLKLKNFPTCATAGSQVSRIF